MKKIVSNILALVCLFALVLGSAEKPDGSCDLVWTLSCIAIAALCGWGWSKLNPEDKQPLTK